MKRVHLIGICGTAMATLAALLKRRGLDVQGSDEHVYPPMSDFLAAEGIPILEGYRAEHIDASLDLVYILFPDPWPKTRHHKRRLIQPEFLTDLARVMKPGAELRFATDWANYASWTLEHVTRDARFLWLAERADDWRKPWPGHVTTRYEAKKLGDCAPMFLRFARLE